jgi:hypothetical protein
MNSSRFHWPMYCAQHRSQVRWRLEKKEKRISRMAPSLCGPSVKSVSLTENGATGGWTAGESIARQFAY